MKLTPWNKKDDLSPFNGGIDELMQQFMRPMEFGLANRLPKAFQEPALPAMNVAESKDAFTVTLDLPGLDSEDIEIHLMGNTLTIEGERRWKEEREGEEVHRVESQYGSFQRSLTLPEGLRLDNEKIAAAFDRGILTIRFPKLEPTPTRKIKVSSKS